MFKYTCMGHIMLIFDLLSSLPSLSKAGSGMQLMLVKAQLSTPMAVLLSNFLAALRTSSAV